ncbi:MAG: hypothetical protein LBL90_12450, partial [Prevotellaceae bacterium]|nr:hypothetical protein [Prevotellaceae bacterium]
MCDITKQQPLITFMPYGHKSKIRRIFEESSTTYIKMYAQIDEQTSTCSFEERYRKAVSSFAHDLYHAM